MEGSPSLAMVTRAAAILVLLGWLMIWIMVPTNTYEQKWRPQIQGAITTTYFGTQGPNILIFTIPILFASVLGCIYAYLEKRSTHRRITRLAIWKRPLLLKGPLGIVSSLEVAFFLMFLLLVVWCFSSYLRLSFSSITPSSAADSGQKLWQARLDITALRLGLVGNMCLAFLFFPVTRGSSLLPLVGLTSESSVRYHIWVGHIVMIFFTAHGLAYITYWIATDNISEMLSWKKAYVSNVAGEVALVCGLLLWATTIPRIRRKMFEVFFYTHQLYSLLLLFLLLHVGISFFCLILPGIYLFVLDRFLRFLQSRRRVSLVSARLLPDEIVELTFAKHAELNYTAASLVFINVPSISKLQWHPFTVSSSSSLEPERLSVIVKKEGSWTQKLCQKLSSSSAPDHLDVSVEGPYGPISDDFLRYDSLVLISGGGGITPFISIIRELIHSTKFPNCPSPDVHLICAFKTSSDLGILSLLLPSSNPDASHLRLRIDAFVTREKNPTTDGKSHSRTILFRPSPSTMPISPILGANSWLWLAALIACSFVAYLVMLGLVNRYYIYPIDRNTDQVYSYTARALLNLLILCVAIGVLAGLAVMRGRRAMEREGRRLRVGHAPTPTDTPGHYLEGEEGMELESLSGEALVEDTKVHYGVRPDLKKMLIECREPNTGVLVSGPTSLRRDVAAICACGLMNNLHFESVSFTW